MANNIIIAYKETFQLDKLSLAYKEMLVKAYDEAIKAGQRPNQADRVHYAMLKLAIKRRYEYLEGLSQEYNNRW